MGRLAILNARLGSPCTGPTETTLVLEAGRIAAIGPATTTPAPAEAEVLDARGLLAVPGLIDFHTHGALGVDYFGAPPDEIARVLEWLPSTGVTGLLLTTTTAPPPELLAAIGTLGALVDRRSPGARPLGIHLEGPWIARAQRGAQLEAAIRPPSLDEFQRLQDAARGHIRAVTLAPELPGALELIEHLARTGVVAAVGHSDATFAEVETAVAAGLRHATHCYNRMRPLHHREPGVVGAALTLPDLSADVVLDGHHVHPAAAKLLLAAKGAEGVGLITDAMQATGLGDGEYVRPGDRRVTVRDGVVRLDSGALAGSVLTLDQAVRNATRWLGLGLGAAAQLAGGLAARVLGLNEQPALAVGADADICLLDGDGCIAATIVGGQVAYQHRGATPWKE